MFSIRSQGRGMTFSYAQISHFFAKRVQNEVKSVSHTNPVVNDHFLNERKRQVESQSRKGLQTNKDRQTV